MNKKIKGRLLTGTLIILCAIIFLGAIYCFIVINKKPVYKGTFVKSEIEYYEGGVKNRYLY